ncbi:hypothetical protein TNCV_1420221 [Trichonephila clavipes]|nr:hypothetical protein TNCV_1420221 [Trichonephila clavipes]
MSDFDSQRANDVEYLHHVVLVFFPKIFGLYGKQVVNIMANSVRICCGRAVFEASASAVSQCASFSRGFSSWKAWRVAQLTVDCS